MKRIAGSFIVAMMLVMAVHAQQEEPTPAKAAARSLERVASEVIGILGMDDVRYALDLVRLRREYGITWQPSLTAPNDLVNRLGKDQLGYYAGIKMFDAIYATTMFKYQDAADAVAVIEQIEAKLGLRDYADLNNYFLKTLKKTAADPTNVNVLQLMNQLAKDYVRELPALMSSPESAAYLIDSLYGYGIQMDYVNGALAAANPDKLMPALSKYGSGRVQKMILDLFQAFDRMDDDIRVGGDTQKKLTVVKSRYELEIARKEGRLNDEQGQAFWDIIEAQSAAIRSSMLTPPAK